MNKLFETFKTDKLELSNRIAMAPLTRGRAIGNVPNNLMVTYYAQRAEAGLIITEGTSPSINGLGYPNIPGAYSEAQIAGWKKITEAVHAKGGKIFLQIMHVGRIAHELNIPEGGEIVAPSAIAAQGDMFTMEGMKPNALPRKMTLADIENAQNEYVQTAKNAVEAGFDGVEIHAANGYLPNQFLNTKSNQRNDEYGGSIENRNRFVLEITQKVVDAVGAEKTGIRLSPYGVFNDLEIYDTIPETYAYLVNALNELNLAYLHLLDTSVLGSEAGSLNFLLDLVKDYKGAVLFNGGFVGKLNEAEKLVNQSDNYFISIGAMFISNPDLVSRLKTGDELAAPDQNTFYTPTKEGYIDYPTLAEANA